MKDSPRFNCQQIILDVKFMKNALSLKNSHLPQKQKNKKKLILDSISCILLTENEAILWDVLTTKYSEVAESHNSNPDLKLSWLDGAFCSNNIVTPVEGCRFGVCGSRLYSSSMERIIGDHSYPTNFNLFGMVALVLKVRRYLFGMFRSKSTGLLFFCRVLLLFLSCLFFLSAGPFS